MYIETFALENKGHLTPPKKKKYPLSLNIVVILKFTSENNVIELIPGQRT